jgi:hypothetical protein
MYPNHLGCFRIGRVGIIDNQDETFSAVGDTPYASGGEISSPSQVYLAGM